MKLQLHQQRQQQCQRYQAAIKAKMRTNFRPRLAIKQPLYANAPCNNVNYLAFHFSLAFSFVPQIKLIFLLFILCRPHTYFHAHAHAYTTTCTQWNNLNLSFQSFFVQFLIGIKINSDWNFYFLLERNIISLLNHLKRLNWKFFAVAFALSTT